MIEKRMNYIIPLIGQRVDALVLSGKKMTIARTAVSTEEIDAAARARSRRSRRDR